MRRIYSRSLPEPQEPATPGRTLTLDRYLELWRIDLAAWREFNRWMADHDLQREFIYEVTFGEGELRAKCYSRDEHGKAYLEGDDAARCERTFQLSTPPPPSLLPYLV